jgi:hypothetical protein
METSGCLPCKEGEVTNYDGSGCVCDTGRYDTSAGLIACFENEVQSTEFALSRGVLAGAQNDLNRGIVCTTCPSCVDCDSLPGVPLRGEGWEPTFAATQAGMTPRSISTVPKTYFECPTAAACAAETLEPNGTRPVGAYCEFQTYASVLPGRPSWLFSSHVVGGS